MMKKVLIIMLMILLCACSENRLDDLKNSKSEITTDQALVKVTTYLISGYDLEKNYSVSDGIKTIDLDHKLSDGDTSVFTVYCDDAPIFLFLKDKDGERIVKPEEAMKRMDEDHYYVIVETEENIYCVSSKEILLIDGDEDYELPKDTETLTEKVKEAIKEENPMSQSRTAIEKKSSSGLPKQQANDRVIVRFKDGNREKQIADYEKFCHGKAQSGVNSSDIYLFIFDPLSDEDLKKLIEESEKLDYVAAVSVDKISELQRPASEKQ